MGGRPSQLLGHTFAVVRVEIHPIKLKTEGTGVQFAIKSLLDDLVSFIELIQGGEHPSKIAVPNHVVTIELKPLPLEFEGVLIATHETVGIPKVPERHRLARVAVEPFAVDAYLIVQISGHEVVVHGINVESFALAGVVAQFVTLREQLSSL